MRHFLSVYSHPPKLLLHFRHELELLLGPLIRDPQPVISKAGCEAAPCTDHLRSTVYIHLYCNYLMLSAVKRSTATDTAMPALPTSIAKPQLMPPTMHQFKRDLFAKYSTPVKAVIIGACPLVTLQPSPALPPTLTS